MFRSSLKLEVPVQSKVMRLPALASAMTLAASVAFASSANASMSSSDPTFPSDAGKYVASADGPNCFPAHGLCLIPGQPSSLVNDFSKFEGGNQTIVASVHYTFAVTDLSLKPIGSFFVFGTLAQTIFGRSSATQTGSWNSQVTWLKLNGEFINGKRVRVSLNTNTPSLGTVSVTPSSGGFEIANSFDVNATLAVGVLPPVQVNLGTVHVGLQSDPASVSMR